MIKYEIARDERVIAWKRTIYEVEAESLNDAIKMVLTDDNPKGDILKDTIKVIPGSVEVYDLSSNK